MICVSPNSVRYGEKRGGAVVGPEPSVLLASRTPTSFRNKKPKGGRPLSSRPFSLLAGQRRPAPFESQGTCTRSRDVRQDREAESPAALHGATAPVSPEGGKGKGEREAATSRKGGRRGCPAAARSARPVGNKAEQFTGLPAPPGPPREAEDGRAQRGEAKRSASELRPALYGDALRCTRCRCGAGDGTRTRDEGAVGSAAPKARPPWVLARKDSRIGPRCAGSASGGLLFEQEGALPAAASSDFYARVATGRTGPDRTGHVHPPSPSAPQEPSATPARHPGPSEETSQEGPPQGPRVLGRSSLPRACCQGADVPNRCQSPGPLLPLFAEGKSRRTRRARGLWCETSTLFPWRSLSGAPVRGWGPGRLVVRPGRRVAATGPIRPPNPRSFDAAASTSYARQASGDSHFNWPAAWRRSRPVRPWDAGKVVAPWPAGPLFQRGGGAIVGRSQISTRLEGNVRREGRRAKNTRHQDKFGGKYISRGGKWKRTKTREHCSEFRLSRSRNSRRQRVRGMPGSGDDERDYKSP
jgi:hypothetical protein